MEALFVMTQQNNGEVLHNNQGRVVVVTGGAKGIGRAICEAFVNSGASVVSMDIDADALAELPNSIRRHIGDTSVDEHCSRIIESTVGEFGCIDVLINNAAIQPPNSYASLHELAPEVLQSMVDVNLIGYANMAKHGVRHMLKRKQGVIVNIASAQGHRTARQVGVYGPIKAANIMQARQWGVEYARNGIRVVSVSPGAIDTPLVRSSLESQGGEAELANRHPLGRIGHPDEVARAVLWLCSSDASFITATDLEVDGGLGAFAAFADPYPNRPH